MIKNDEGEIEAVKSVVDWVHNLWSYDGWNEPCKSDAISILKEVLEEGKRFRCVEYGIVTEACLVVLGIPCRTLFLKIAD